MTDQRLGFTSLAEAAQPQLLLPVAMLAVFTISLGFGILLPQLPALLERFLGAAGTPVLVSRATGMLTALYMTGLFIFAPLWGRLSDRWGRRPVLLIGLAGFGATMISFAFLETLAAVYAERALSGMFAAAVTPVALAAVTDFTAAKSQLGRRLTFVSLAGISGFLLGPTLGVVLTRSLSATGGAADALTAPLVATGGLAMVTALAVALTFPATGSKARVVRDEPSVTSPSLVRLLLALGLVVSAGVAVFEVGLALRGKQDLGFTPVQIALMFTLCSVVMIVVQAVVFSPLLKPEATRWLIAPAFLVMGASLFGVPLAVNFGVMLALVGSVAASAGILSPILTYWIASHAGHKSGAELGKQSSTASLGAAIGSGAGGLLYDVSWLPNTAFVMTSAMVLLAVWPSLSLPGRLMSSKTSDK